MCGRIGLPQLTWAQFVAWQRGELDWDEVYREESAAEQSRSFNLKPTQQAEIAIAQGTKLMMTTARWWLVPHWFKGGVKEWRPRTINAKIETAAEKPAFRSAWASHRCVFPVAGYYEWTGVEGAKQPWWITAQTNAPATYLAGLHSQLRDGTRTATVLTREAVPQIRHIHPRMPVLLTYDQIWPWLTNGIGTVEAKNALGTGWEGRMNFHKVARFGRDDDGPKLIEPLAEA